jgi:two-component system NtrC family sensor kinase
VSERRNTGGRTASASGIAPRIARVLIVDDEPLIGKSLCMALGDEFEIHTAADPAVALEWLTSGDWFDVIFCDLMMPTMSGVDLRARVVERSPELAARIVFITGGLLLPHVQALLESVPNTVLAKPFDLDAMRDLIRRRTAPVPGSERSII